MCGIIGFYGFEDKALLKNMTKSLTHRGPDDFGYYSNKLYSLGHRRLSIIDLSKNGKQPMCNEDEDIWITYNGEIYNFLELKNELEEKGYKFKSDTDTEVIINAYEEWGVDCLHKFNGMFAFCIYDVRHKRLFLARDRMGIKPLYFYFNKKGSFFFASEMKAFFEYPEFKGELNKEAMKLFFAHEFVPNPHTIYKDVHKLPAGCYVIHEKGLVTQKSYWNPSFNVQENSEKYIMDNIINKLTESVKLRLMSDVPLGAFLSGGIDSSAIVALMSKINNEPPKTFSIGFEDKSFDETHKSRIVSELYNTDHHEKIISPKELIKLMTKLPLHMDEPFGDPSLIPTYVVSEFTRKDVTVSLSGDGGDELFAGYDWYAGQYYAQHFYKHIPFKSFIPKIVNKIPQTKAVRGFTNKLKRFVDSVNEPEHNRQLRWLNCFGPDEENNLLYNDKIIEPYNKTINHTISLEKFLNAKPGNSFNGMIFADWKHFLQDDILTKVDMASMKVSLEARTPFLDHNFVEFTSTIPERYKAKMKINGLDRKHILKKALLAHDLLPKKILYGEKQGFTLPLKNWLRDDLKFLLDTYLNEDEIKQNRIFNYRHINKLVHQHLTYKKDNQRQLWAYIVFNMWYEENEKKRGRI